MSDLVAVRMMISNAGSKFWVEEGGTCAPGTTRPGGGGGTGVAAASRQDAPAGRVGEDRCT